MPSRDDPRLLKCGFAKLVGPDVEVYMRKYEIHIGRKSKSTALDVVLGDNMNISRHHATIKYSFETGRFELIVLGKNGVTVRGTLHTPQSPPVALQSQDRLQVGDHVFYFLLPKDVSKLKTNKRKRAPSQSAAKRPAAIAAPAYSGEEDYSEDYGAQYPDDEYNHRQETLTPQANYGYEDGYTGDEDEEYEEEEEPVQQHHNHQQHDLQNEEDMYEDEDEEGENYEDHYTHAQPYYPPAGQANHRSSYRGR